MTPHTRKSHLISLREQIASLRVVQCRMLHERIVESANASPPAVNSHRYTRIGLCSPEQRAERLGCSHTMSRVHLDRVISELSVETAAPLQCELNWLTNEIHLLDHRKGAAEARLAAAALAEKDAGAAPAMLSETEEVQRLERQHDEYVERVGVLRDRVVSELDKLIEALSP